MQLVRLPLALIAFSSLACTMNAEPPAEDPAVTIVGNDESQLPVGTGGGGSGPIIQRFDFAISNNDPRTCASFNKKTSAGSWTTFSSFPSGPIALREKFCAALWIPGARALANLSDLGLDCNESVSVTERSAACAKLGAAGGPACASTATFMARTAGVAFKNIELACPVVKPPFDRAAELPATDKALMYTGGCTSCGSISNGILLLTSPRPWAFVNFYDTSSNPQTLRFEQLNGPAAFNVSAYHPTGQVIVSY